ncbi:hypothetical protein ACXWPH_10105, partial [Streptococcus pyogenes]
MRTDRTPAENLDAAGGRSGRSRYTAETVAAFPSATPRKPAPIKGIREIIDAETGEVFQVSRQHNCTLKIEKSPQQ